MTTSSQTGGGYVPGPTPYDNAEFTRYVQDELYKVAAVLNILLEGQLCVAYEEPPKPTDGSVRLADGTQWNPGGGEGVYCYYNSTWNKLG